MPYISSNSGTISNWVRNRLRTVHTSPAAAAVLIRRYSVEPGRKEAAASRMRQADHGSIHTQS